MFRAVNDLPDSLYPIVVAVSSSARSWSGRSWRSSPSSCAGDASPWPPCSSPCSSSSPSGREGGGQPRAPGDVDRARRRAPRRRPRGRRELRVRSRRARRRAGRRRHARTSRGAGRSCRGCSCGASWSGGCTSAPTTRSTSSVARRSASPSPVPSTWQPSVGRAGDVARRVASATSAGARPPAAWSLDAGAAVRRRAPACRAGHAVVLRRSTTTRSRSARSTSPRASSLAEVYSQALEAAGFEVERAFALGPREFVGPALAAGLVELRPRVRRHGGRVPQPRQPQNRPTTSRPRTTSWCAALDGDPSSPWLPRRPQDANTFVVTRGDRAPARPRALSDLAAVAGAAGRSAGRPSARSAPLCLVGLDDVYGAHVRRVRRARRRRAAHRPGAAGRRTSTSPCCSRPIPRSSELDLVELADDRGLQPAENITPLVPREVVERWGDGVVDVIDAMSARLTTADGPRAQRAPPAKPDADVAAVAAAVVGGGRVVTTTHSIVGPSGTGPSCPPRSPTPSVPPSVHAGRAGAAGRRAPRRRCRAASAGPGRAGSSPSALLVAWLIVMLLSSRGPGGVTDQVDACDPARRRRACAPAG